jgi:hypothetical protein
MAINQDFQNRVDAYKGNPEALTQRYQQNQQLIDLLALQKIKSEKEAAVRQMQMAMAQQQAASGEAPMTVAQQREKEVMGLTKDELAGQQGELLQQQQGEQQAAMQKLMSGIASAPGAQNAAAPQAMAAGGIVAFNGDGPSQEVRKPRRGYIIDPETGDERPMTIRELYSAGQAAPSKTESTAGMALRSVGNVLDPRDPDARQKQQEYLKDEERRRGITQAMSAVTPGLFEQLEPETRGIMRQQKEYLRGELDRKPTDAATATAPTPTGAYRDESREDRRVGPISPPPPPPPPPARRPAGPAGPAASAAPAAPAGLAPEQTEMQTALSQGILGALRTNPAAEQGAEYMRASNILGMSPEEKATIARNRAATEAADRRRFDPEKQRGEALTNFLLGAGGQSTGLGALGAGGRSMVNYQRSMEDQERQSMSGRQKEVEGDIERGRGIRGKAYAGGLEALKQASQLQNQGMVSGASLVSTAQTAQTAATRLLSENRWKDLEAESARATARATQAAAAASRDETAYNNYNARATKILAEIADATNDVAKTYKSRLDQLDNQKQDDPKVKQARQDLITQFDNEVNQRTRALKEMAKRLDDEHFQGRGKSAGNAGAPSGGITVRGSSPVGGK